MNSQFVTQMRISREMKHLYLRQHSPLLEMDMVQLSKIEEGLRQFKRYQIPLIGEIIKTSCDELMTLWLADQIYEVVKDEKLANAAMQVAEQKLNYIKRKQK